MLKFAYNFNQQIKEKLAETMSNEKYKYFYLMSYIDLEFKIESDTWAKISFVSVKDNELLGLFIAEIDRSAYKVSNIVIINFNDKQNFTFSKDLHQFLTDLFTKYNFNKIEFKAIPNNPAVKMYEKLIRKYNGRFVGVQKETVKLYDGKFYDLNIYEIFRKDYIKQL